MTSHIPHADQASYPARPGNFVRPLIDSFDAFSRICEAVETARHSIWLTVAFLNLHFEMPGNRGTLFEVCQTAAQRGVNVRILFWRSAEWAQTEPGTHFHGQDEQATILSEQAYCFSARWDALPGNRCHHQKSWLIDAGTPHEVAFIGGANPGTYAVADRGHTSPDQGPSHDLYCELKGPSATDVHHNFVQRWNGASERDAPDGRWRSTQIADDLPHPETLTPSRGTALVQIARTIRKEQYDDGYPAVGVASFPIKAGERSILEQYHHALGNAQRSIYIEDQHIASLEILIALEGALKRGVEIVYLLPGQIRSGFSDMRKAAPGAPLFQQLSKLADYDNFTLAGLCASLPDGTCREIYVHSKIACVDDHWITIGSCNISDRSLHSHTEMNITTWDDHIARALRIDLLQEHLNLDTSESSDHHALRDFRAIALENSKRKSLRMPLQGLAFAIDPRVYGL